ncbi:hypothetical protein [Asticcacaulis sp. EMRT-3]|uniref:hypothetical protein n=1 Tax=Asticcacaulis sp. EMRT-3 TaxID=3040349 RepID=UPI0024AE9C57|nr:hypothetical protein [Asticcacaulis sp. EMRT-3]MDI7775303.1 hypothetical protein [Asticcacaulis sp. EMRT-3]
MCAARRSRDFRNLANISETASTSRILNLNHVYVHCARDPDYALKPFFHNPKLNKAILIKHSLRPDEVGLFGKPRRSATKIILPFESQDLRLGGESLFVNQTGFDKQMRAFVDVMEVSGQRDLEVLRLLDSLPSLDPFILRETLARQGISPAGCYLKISNGDIAAMIAFANAEIERLINIAFTGGQSHAAMRFTDKILADRLDHELEPLKDTLRLSSSQFSDGIFSWRGFLYFKWRNLELRDQLRALIDNLMKYRASGMVDKALQAYLDEVRPRLLQRILTALDHVGQSLLHYDEAYLALIEGQNPAPFRHFLLEGPKLFFELGERVGILTHIASFWAYRMGVPGQRMTQLEYADTLHDFDQSLACIFIDEVG